jgi:purine-binding chemotaxis protein CheW
VQLREGRKELLAIRLGGESCAIGLDGVLEVVRPRVVTPVPFVPPWIVGVMLLRGAMVPIFHVGRLLGLSGDGLEPGERILIVPRGTREGEVGLLVDEVREVISVPAQDLLPPEAPALAGWVVALARKGGKGHAVLDHRRIAGLEVPS